MARYEEYKLGRFSAGVRNNSENEKIIFKPGDFSIILVLNFVHCTSGRLRQSYDKSPEKAWRNQKSERRQGRRYLRKSIQEKESPKDCR